MNLAKLNAHGILQEEETLSLSQGVVDARGDAWGVLLHGRLRQCQRHVRSL